MDYKATLNLPKTDFPMKANSPGGAADRSPGGTRSASTSASRGRADRPLWILHDGPPYCERQHPHGPRAQQGDEGLVVKSRGMLGFNAGTCRAGIAMACPSSTQVDKATRLDTASVDVRRAMDPLEKIGKCARTPRNTSRSSARSSSDSALRRLGQPVHHDGARVPGGDRARVRPVRGQGPRLQGPEAVHCACTT